MRKTQSMGNRNQALQNRARTAIGRADLSRPLKCAIEDGLVSKDAKVFDYGCGRGGDVKRLEAMGYDASGWDPVHRAGGERRSAPIVNLGYVVNVIENARERQEVLRRAWELTENVLVVSARLNIDGRALQHRREYMDGCLTGLGTFQKFFDQQELRNWINSTLDAKAVPAAPGIFYVFQDQSERATFVANRYRRRSVRPRISKSAELFSKHEELLEPLMSFVGERGRLPEMDEIDGVTALSDVFGSIRKAFRVVLNVTDEKQWKDISKERSHDLLVYLALAQFDGRPLFSRLPLALQRDVRAFFGTYKKACTVADQLLYSLGSSDVIDATCQQSPIGKLTPAAIYLHESALEDLSPILRLYEGCASGYLGRVEGANIIKLYRNEPKVSYLNYPRFDRDAHPALDRSVTVHLQSLRVQSRDYTYTLNRPILHRKELFVSSNYPQFAKFARLTRIEESKGLYETTSRIGTNKGWTDALARKGLTLQGHRLLSAKNH